jgi:hypothetical protein
MKTATDVIANVQRVFVLADMRGTPSARVLAVDETGAALLGD